MLTQQTILNARGSIYTDNLEEVELVPVPNATETYTPLAYSDLVHVVEEHAEQILPNYSLERAEYVLAKQGQRFFGTLTYRNGISDDIGLRIGLRTSYDKTLSHALVTGAGVFVCSNGMFNGTIRVLRRHTKESIEDVHNMFADAIRAARGDFRNAVADADRLRNVPMDVEDGYKLLGLAAGRELLTPTQFSKAIREQRIPSHDEFLEENAWRPYMAATEALKSSPPQTVMEKYRSMHDLFQEQVLGESLPN